MPTIVSRCQVLKLRPLSVDETAKGMQFIKGVPAEIAEVLAHISGGRPGYAMRLFEQPRLLEQRQTWLQDLGSITRQLRVVIVLHLQSSV